MVNQTVNPYTNLKMWLRYEMLDIDSIIEAIDKRAYLEKLKNDLELKLEDDKKQRNKIKDGKLTLSTFYKSETEKAVTLEQIEQKIMKGERDTEVYNRLTQIVTLQLNQAAIQFFKDRKLSQYYKAMKLFS